MFKIKFSDLNNILSNKKMYFNNNLFSDFFQKAVFEKINGQPLFQYLTQLNIEIRKFLHSVAYEDTKYYSKYIHFDDESYVLKNSHVLKNVENLSYNLVPSYDLIPFHFQYLDLKINPNNIDELINFSSNIKLGTFSDEQVIDFIDSINPEVHGNSFNNLKIKDMILTRDFLSVLSNSNFKKSSNFYHNLFYILFPDIFYENQQAPIQFLIHTILTDLDQKQLLSSFINNYPASYLNISSEINEQVILKVFETNESAIANNYFYHFLNRNDFKYHLFSENFLEQITSFSLDPRINEFLFISILKNKQKKYYSLFDNYLEKEFDFNNLFNMSEPDTKCLDPYFYINLVNKNDKKIKFSNEINTQNSSLLTFINTESIDDIILLFKNNPVFLNNFINSMSLFLQIEGKSYVGNIVNTISGRRVNIPIKILEKNETNSKIFSLIDKLHETELIFDIPVSRQTILVNVLTGKFYDYFIKLKNNNYQMNYKMLMLSTMCANQYREHLLHFQLISQKNTIKTERIKSKI